MAHHTRTLSFSARASLPTCSPLSAYLLRLMTIKCSNLCVSADVTSSSELLQIAEELGDQIVVLKTHVDIVADLSDRTIRMLREIAERKHFLIFEDRKFADIGSTVQKQYGSGSFKIAQWASIVTTHLFPGPAILTALEKTAASVISQNNTTVYTEISGGSMEGDSLPDPYNLSDSPMPERNSRESDTNSESSEEHSQFRDVRKQSIVSISTTISTKTEPISPQPTNPGLCCNSSSSGSTEDAYRHLGPIPYLRSALVLAQMSSQENFFTPEYTANCVKIARQHQAFVLGFISQENLNSTTEDNFLTFTPGVKMVDSGMETGDDLGQQYLNPKHVICHNGADIIIVGRGILHAHDRHLSAENYRREGWEAYLSRVKSEHSS